MPATTCQFVPGYIAYNPSFTGFGSALNIETLVAAAEKRETPIEVLWHMSFIGPSKLVLVVFFVFFFVFQ